MTSRILRVLFGVILGLCASEYLVRVLVTEPELCLIPDPVLNHMWRPNYTCDHPEWFQKEEEAYTVHYNSEGWRGESEIPLEKPKGEYRIFFVGDSFTAGTVKVSNAMPSVVREILTPRFSEAGETVRVVNTGTSSYSPAIYYLLLKEKILKYSPDLVVLNVDMTDVTDDFIYSQIAELNSKGEPIGYPPHGSFAGSYVRVGRGLRPKTSVEMFLGWFGTKSRLLSLIRDQVVESYNKSIPVDPKLPQTFDWCTHNWSEQTETLVGKTRENIQKIIDLLNLHKVKVVITAVPHLDQFKGEELIGEHKGLSNLRPLKEIEAIAVENKIPYFNTYSALLPVAGKNPEQIFIPGDMHYNAKGYEAWGRAYAEFIWKEKSELYN